MMPAIFSPSPVNVTTPDDDAGRRRGGSDRQNALAAGFQRSNELPRPQRCFGPDETQCDGQAPSPRTPP